MCIRLQLPQYFTNIDSLVISSYHVVVKLPKRAIFDDHITIVVQTIVEVAQVKLSVVFQLKKVLSNTFFRLRTVDLLQIVNSCFRVVALRNLLILPYRCGFYIDLPRYIVAFGNRMLREYNQDYIQIFSGIRGSNCD